MQVAKVNRKIELTPTDEEMNTYDRMVSSKGNNFFPEFLTSFFKQRRVQLSFDTFQSIERELKDLEPSDREQMMLEVNQLHDRVKDRANGTRQQRRIRDAERALEEARDIPENTIPVRNR